MDKVIYITPSFAVTAALTATDMNDVQAMGFRSVISNLPDGESNDQLTGRQEAVHAWRAGLTFRHLPASKLELFTDASIEPMEIAIRSMQGPILAHCKSGIRSAILWAAVSARSQPVDCVIAALADAGFELDFLRDDLDQQADRRRWLGMVPAIDCGCEERRTRAATAA